MAAPAFQVSTTGKTADGVPSPSLTFSHTPAGANRVLLVAVTVDRDTTSETISGITFNGVALTFVAAVNYGSGGGSGREELWRLIAPAAVTANIVVTLAASGVQEMSAVACTYTGADQTTPLSTPVTNSGTGTAPTVTVSSSVTDKLVHTQVGLNGALPTANGLGTNRGSAVANTAVPAPIAATEVDTQAGAASVTQTWTSAAVPWGTIGVEINGLAAAPSNTVAPVVSGTAQVGATLTTDNGSWDGSPTSYSYQWKRADDAGFTTAVTNIGTNSPSYLLTASEAAKYVRCVVTATNGTGSTAANSNILGAVTNPAAPTNSVAPVVSGTVEIGAALSTTDGTWNNSPLSFTYQWQRFVSGSWGAIAGATGSSYLIGSADVSFLLRCVVTAANASGSAAANSNSLGPVPAQPQRVALPPGVVIEMEFDLDPTATGGTDNWQRVTHLVKSWTIRRGRNARLERVDTGTFNGVFDNTDRRFETGYQGALLNVLDNSSLEVDALGWSTVGGGTGALNGRFIGGSVSIVGQSFWGISRSTAVLQVGDGVRIVKRDTSRISVGASQVWTASMFVARNGAADVPVGKIQLLEYNAAGTLIQTTDGPAAACPLVAERRSVTVTTQATTATVAIQFVVTATGSAANAQIKVDAVQLEAGPLTSYLDGDQDNGRWEGARHQSRSYRGGPYHPNLRPMRRIRVLALRGNLVRDNSLSTSPVVGGSVTTVDPDDAKVWMTGSSSSVTRVTSPVPQEGTYAYSGTQAAGVTSLIDLGRRWWIPVEPGQVVTLSAYLRKASATNPKASILIQEYDRFGAAITNKGLTLIDPPQGSWQRYQTTQTIDQGTAWIGVRVYLSTIDSAGGYADAVQLEFGPTMSDYKKTKAGVQERFRGYIKRFPQESPSYKRGETTITAVDGFAALAKGKFSDSPPLEGSAARITRVLDAFNWPTGLRVLDAGTKTLGATESSGAEYILNTGAESDVTNIVQHGTATISRSTTQAKLGYASAKTIVSSGGQGVKFQSATGKALAVGESVAGSVWVRGNVGGEALSVITRIVNTDASTTDSTTSLLEATTVWQKISPAAVAVAAGKTGDRVEVIIYATTGAATWFSDEAHAGPAVGAGVNVSHLQHLLDVAETELGLFFIDGFGRAVFHDANHRTSNPRSTRSQYTFGDAVRGVSNTIPDYSFEGGVVGWLAWSHTGGAIGVPTRITSDAIEGGACAEITRVAASTGLMLYSEQNGTPVKAGDTLRMSGWIKPVTAGCTALELRASYYNDGVLTNESVVQSIASPTTGAWRQLSADVVVPAGVELATVTLGANYPSTANLTVRFDKVELIPLTGWDGELPFLPSVLPDVDVEDVINEVRATRIGGIEQVASDATSQARYFTISRSFSTLHSTDAGALVFAQAIVAKFKEPGQNIQQLDFEPSRHDDAWDAALFSEISDRITWNRRPQGGVLMDGSGPYFVEAIEERVELGETKVTWLVTLMLSKV